MNFFERECNRLGFPLGFSFFKGKLSASGVWATDGVISSDFAWASASISFSAFALVFLRGLEIERRGFLAGVSAATSPVSASSSSALAGIS